MSNWKFHCLNCPECFRNVRLRIILLKALSYSIFRFLNELFNRLRAFRRAKILDQWIVGFCVCYVCGFAGLWFVDLLCFLASWVYGLAFFEKKS